MTDTNSTDLEVEIEIQAATNAFGAVLPKLKMYNGTVLPSLLSAMNARQEVYKSTITQVFLI